MAIVEVKVPQLSESVAEATEGTELEMKADAMPAWFKTALWDRFGGVEEMADTH